MTPEEAKEKWCFAAVASHTDPRRGFHGNDDDKYGATFPCIADKCAAWRWGAHSRKDDVDFTPLTSMNLSARTINSLTQSGFQVIGDVRMKSDMELMRHPNFGRKSLNELRAAIRAVDDANRTEYSHGYCGLAGRPE